VSFVVKGFGGSDPAPRARRAKQPGPGAEVPGKRKKTDELPTDEPPQGA
jgi:hypothetical protein